jgi:hypothetical protein
MKERIEAIRDKTKETVCLSYSQWAYKDYGTGADYNEEYELWVAALNVHFRGLSEEAVVSLAEQAVGLNAR